jgi:hypothetical protein
MQIGAVAKRTGINVGNGSVCTLTHFPDRTPPRHASSKVIHIENIEEVTVWRPRDTKPLGGGSPRRTFARRCNTSSSETSAIREPA